MSDLSSGERSIRAANISRARRVIHQRLCDPDLALADVARESGLSLGHLHHLFQNEGCTLWEYLKSARLQRARELLESASAPSVTITDISAQCGFSNTSYFSTAFQRAFESLRGMYCCGVALQAPLDLACIAAFPAHGHADRSGRHDPSEPLPPPHAYHACVRAVLKGVSGCVP